MTTPAELPNAASFLPLERALIAVLCAAVGSVFAATDAALGSLNPARLTALKGEAQGIHADALSRYLADPTRAHARWLVGRVVFTALSAVLLSDLVPPSVPGWAVAPLAALGALLSYGTLAEVATTLARHRADNVATRLLGYLRPLELPVLPLAVPLSALSKLISRWLGPDTPGDARVTETEVEWAVMAGQKSGSLAPEPAEMIRNVLELKDVVGRDVMIPRTRVSAVEVDTPLTDVLKFVASEGHSRYPVYREKVDNVVGLLYAKDLFKVVRDGRLADTSLGDLVRGPVNFVPETQGVSSILREMRSRRLHMAVVIDEFGGVSGIVTLEDILEEIVGDIRDEYDTEEAPIQDLGNGRLIADAAVSVHDLSAYLGHSLPDDGGDYESLGGMLTHRAGRVPEVGSKLEAFGLSFIVRDADERRIAKVEILRGETDAGTGNSNRPAPSEKSDTADSKKPDGPENDKAAPFAT